MSRAKSKPRATRTFSGCWTCRLRKLKCDATRPKCVRCQKANVECKGYNIVLVWADVSTLDGNRMVSLSPADSSDARDGSLRRNVALARFPPDLLYQSYAELNTVICQLDELQPAPRLSGLHVGPFSVYELPRGCVKKPVRRKTPSASPSVVGKLSRDDLETMIFSKTENAYVHYELLDYAKLTIMAIKGPRHRLSEQGMFHILYPKFFPNIDLDDWRPNARVLSTLFSRDDSDNIVLSPSISSAIDLLLQSFMASMRVSHRNCPWNVLVIPFIKLIFFEIICEEYPRSRSWKAHIIERKIETVSRELLIKNIKFAIFCMCLSLGWHQRSLSGIQVKNTSDSFHINNELKISIELRKFGVNMLNYHLDEYDGNCNAKNEDDYDLYFLLALILQIQLDNIFGVFENHELMYAIGDFILKKEKSSKRHLSPLERHLKSQFNILNIFYESTQAVNIFNYSIPEKVQRAKYLDLNDNYDLTENLSEDEEEDELSDFSEDETREKRASTGSVHLRASLECTRPLSFTVSFEGGQNTAKHSQEKLCIGVLENSVYRIPKQTYLETTQTSHPEIPSLSDQSMFVHTGLPKSLLQLMHEVVQLTNHKNVFNSTGITPRNFPKICAETEDKILNWNVESYWKLYDNEYNPISNVATKKFISEFHEGLYHNVMAFHAALVVYYKRLILESPITHCQNYVQTCTSHMQKLIMLNTSLRTHDAGVEFHPSFWPILVCGCEIDTVKDPVLASKCHQIWRSDCFESFNYWRSKQILYEVWHRRKENDESLSFMDLVREWDIVLSLG